MKETVEITEVAECLDKAAAEGNPVAAVVPTIRVLFHKPFCVIGIYACKHKSCIVAENFSHFLLEILAQSTKKILEIRKSYLI